MAKDRHDKAPSADSVISIVGPGMKVVGDCESDGTIRIDGRVEGSVSAKKAVVVGKTGVVEGTIVTQDAVISGRVQGSLTAQSRLEIQATSRIDGDVHARRMKLEEGATLNGTVAMGERAPSPGSTGRDESEASDSRRPPRRGDARVRGSSTSVEKGAAVP